MRALFVGRFQPFHLGHMHAVRKIVAKYGSVTIAIGSSNLSRTKENPFTYSQRRKMVLAALKSEPSLAGRYSVVALPDLESDAQWREKALSLGKFDAVVTGTAWVARCLKGYLKVERPAYLRRVELNATRIRKIVRGGSGNWRKLVPESVAKIAENHFG